jgi:hypothetical protein
VHQTSRPGQCSDVLVQQSGRRIPDRPVEPVIPAIVDFAGVSARAAAIRAIPHISPGKVTERQILAQKLQAKLLLPFVDKCQGIPDDLVVGIDIFAGELPRFIGGPKSAVGHGVDWRHAGFA